MDYEEALDYLFPLVRHGTKLSLDNTEELLSHVGNPHHSLKFVHVAGSKGKGSVCAFVSSILKEAGYNVGTFTSPHLVDFTERIRVDWEPISRDDVVRLVSELKSIAEKMTSDSRLKSPSFFEMCVAIAFKYFQEREVDIAVVEAGMGGQYDSTNVIQPVLSVITHLSMEHSEHLGRSLSRIAKDKAGIIKEGVPVVLSEESEVFESRCDENDCDLTVLGRDTRFGRESSDHSGQRFWVGNGERKRFHISLLGNYQVQNAATAYAVSEKLKELGYEISDEHVRIGLENASWPGRMHIVRREPTVVVDSTHDVDGAKELVESLRELFKFEKAILVFAALEDKDVRGMAEILAPFSTVIVTTQAQYKKAMPADFAEKEFKRFADSVKTKPTIQEAIDLALEEAGENDLVCITGSIFTASEALAYFGKSSAD
ncbi:MAG: bifunctional folylpolyglutamate synthase/dihydrofolate synthase [Methanobacteriota archaeon]|nr:MAG: bifunctional folylpolyglutamate synthase/dihydrofolate synthase [Euryarchaeota archaeon]